MNIIDAAKEMKKGKKVTFCRMPGSIEFSGENVDPYNPNGYVRWSSGRKEPWAPTIQELLSNKWRIAAEGKD